MKKWRKQCALFFLLVCIIGLFGCSRTKIIDKISIIHVFGFDQADNGDIIGTALYPEYRMSKSNDEIKSLEAQVETGVLFVPQMSMHTSTPVELAKTRVLLFGKEYAEAGISDMVDRFIITPQLGTNIQIAVSTDSARKTLNVFKKEKSLTLAERFEHNMKGQFLPTMNLHVFLNHFYGEGMDTYLPAITIDENDTVMIDGLGVFKGEKLKLILNQDQALLFSILEDRKTQATIKFALDKEFIAVRGFRSKSHWQWDQKENELYLNLRLEWTLSEYPNRFKIERPEDVAKLTNIIVENLEKGLNDLFNTFKENEVDPVGIGNIVRSQDRSWEEESFYQAYPTLPINVNVVLEIIHSGLES